MKRLFYGFLVLLGVVTIVFFLFNVLPADPARMMLGQRADISSIEAVNKELGRDKPLSIQYLTYLNDISPISFHNASNTKSTWYLNPSNYDVKMSFSFGDDDKVLVLKSPYLRRSYQSQRKVSEVLAEAIPLTALLAFVSIIIASMLGIVIGVLSALYKDGIFDKATLVLSVFGMSLPSFFAAILIAWIFAFILSEFTGLNMFGSLYAVDDFGDYFYIDIKNLILPAITLGIRPLAIVSELTRNSFLDVLSQDYIRTAKAKGLSKTAIIMKHALKNALNPIISAISGWFASLLAGAVFVEYVFDWKGLGVVMVDGLEKFDFPVVMGTLLFISVVLVLINIFVDIAYALLDPRVIIE
ncbi:MAG: ABC transporter permease [Bacteroidales bacterium]|nr:ABC transporter permease [Bacteroidales bacterium]